MLLADALMCNWRVLYSFSGSVVLTWSHGSTRHIKSGLPTRKASRKGRSHRAWCKPYHPKHRPRNIQSMPKLLTVREARVRIKQPGISNKRLWSLSRPCWIQRKYSKEDLADFTERDGIRSLPSRIHRKITLVSGRRLRRMGFPASTSMHCYC